MSVQTFSVQMRQVFFGNGLLVICGVFYLIWWVLAFRPNDPVGAVSGWFLAGAAIAGIAGLILLVKGVGALPNERQPISYMTLIIVGVISYIILLIVTYGGFHRQVTSELFLFTAWAVLELSAVNGLYGAEKLSAIASISFCAVVIIAFIVSLFCYVLYYRLSGTASYIDGMIPLLTETVSMIYFAMLFLVVSS